MHLITGTEITDQEKILIRFFYNNKPIETTNRNDNRMSHYSPQGAILYNKVISSNLKNINRFDILE